MRLGTRLRRILVMMIVLLGLLADLGVASAQENAPIPSGEGGLQTPGVADGASATPPSNATDMPLSSPSPIQATTPLSPTPGAPSSATGTPDSTDHAPAKSGEKTDDQAVHTVRFDPTDGSKPTQASVKTGIFATPPQQNPQRQGFRFEGWTLDGRPFDFRTPVLQDMTLKAQWSKATDWTLSPDHGPASGTVLTISPPDRQEPQFAGIQAAGNQILGLTGDGRIYTWTQDGTPKQVPAPFQAADGFRYLQAAAGNRWQAALGSDQRIYTWNSQQSTPAILDTGQDPGFTSISITDNRLLAVDRQGQVYAYQSRDADSQDPNPKFIQQATTSLPGKAQAVTATATAIGRRILIVDADGKAWAWGTTDTGNAKPAHVKQKPGMRIVQAQALNQGFLLLNENGQAWYLADGMSSPTVAGLPDGTQISRINSSGDQATVLDKDGHVWAWKPGEAPTREDDGNQQYMQATAAGSRIIAISRQGGLFAWNPDAQDKQNQPDRLDTTQAPILESASLDCQPLKLSKQNGTWQTDAPAHKPGQTTITLVGRQDGRPFTRSLKYTVDQTLTREVRQGSAYAIHFNTGEGGPTPQDQSIQPVYGRVQRPSPDPTREGYQFDGWFTGNIAYDFSKPVTGNLTLSAKWTLVDPNNTWKINPNKGSQLGKETTTITPPDANRGIRFSQVSGGGYVYADLTGYSLAVGSDGNAYAWGNNESGQLGNGTTAQQNTPAPVPKPAGAPTDFTYVQADAGGYHSLAVGSDGYVYAWGLNDHGQLGNNTTSNSSTPVRVHGPGNTGEGLKAIQVAAGAWNSLALGADGTVYTWGSISKGGGYDCSSPQNVPTTVKDPSDASGVLHAVQISTSWSFDMALGQDGYVYVWGYNNHGQIGNNTTDNSFHLTPSRVFASNKSTAAAGPWLKAVQVSAGSWFALAIGEDGNTWAWGYNEYGSLGNGYSNTDADTNYIPQKVRYPANAGAVAAVQVSAEVYHSLAVDTDGNTWAWGHNDYGQLGDNTTIDRNSPVKVFASAQSTSSAGPWLNTLQVSTGWRHSLAIGTDGVAYAWGQNWYGQLGNPNAGRQSPVPSPVSFNLQPVITGVTFDTSPGTNLIRGDGSSVSVTTPAHLPGTVTVSVKYTTGGAGNTLTDTSLKYTYMPAGVLPKAGGKGTLLVLATGMTGMGGVLASRRHRRETRQLSQASHE
ncbi:MULTISPECIES: InlB B-repeat-containing protein [Bifidobacterium]|uniref:RCC1 domain-containing protein n=1 Tax=Bifidobacterium TaxID=1678 RepID=UPI0018DE450D|nr:MULTISPECIES: InlB B-repeat-containing protein [Bifidobacterium]MBH9980629.1 InlB B-repeat-containing protein [Bifidobacterium asteroides]MBI0100016.1 InlB B-repeat-containing protein [Bifidobacterium sp. W8114]